MSVREMTKDEQDCKDMADVCELAHNRTVAECKTLGIPVNCMGIMDCTDGGQDHGEDAEGTHYGAQSGEIFSKHYDYIQEVTGL